MTLEKFAARIPWPMSYVKWELVLTKWSFEVTVRRLIALKLASSRLDEDARPVRREALKSSKV